MSFRLKSRLSSNIQYGMDYQQHTKRTIDNKALNAQGKMDDSPNFHSGSKHIFLYGGPKMLIQITISTYNRCSQELSRSFAFLGLIIDSITKLHIPTCVHACILKVGCIPVWWILLQWTFSTSGCQAISTAGNRYTKKISVKYWSHHISSCKRGVFRADNCLHNTMFGVTLSTIPKHSHIINLDFSLNNGPMGSIKLALYSSNV